MPIAGAEAMSLGRPIVGSAVDGLQELVVEGVTGLLVPPRDEPALARALVAVLRDPERRGAMGEAARGRFAERFTIGAMIDSWMGCYQRFASAG